MKRPAVIFTGFCGVLTSIACMQIVMTSVTFFGRGAPMRLEPLAWVFSALVLYIVNYALMRKAATIPVYAAANALTLVFAIIALITTAHTLSGFIGYLVTVVLAMLTVAEVIRFTVNTQTVYSRMIRFDAYLMLTFWYFLSVSGGMPMDDIPFILSVLVLNIVCNLMLRSSEEDAGRALTASPMAGVLFSVGLFGLITAVVYGFMRLFASGSRTAVEAFFAALQTGFRVLFSLLGRFFEWLFSLIPFRESEMGFISETVETVAMEEVIPDLIHIPDEVLYTIAAVCSAAIIAMAVVFIYRFRKTRVTLSGFGKTSLWAPARRNKGAGLLKRRLMAIFDSIVFLINSVRYINTPQGTFVSLERWGRKRGKAMKAGQTMREYLLALSPSLRQIADDLDLIYFSDGTGRLTKTDCRRIRRGLIKAHRRSP